MSCGAPAGDLDPLFDTWDAGHVIHVIHDTAFAPETFNPGADSRGKLRKPTRFAPIRDVRGKVVPYLYGGSTLDCAIFETVFQDVPFTRRTPSSTLPTSRSAATASSCRTGH